MIRVLRAVWRRLRRIGIEITPCLLVREALSTTNDIAIDTRFRWEKLGHADLPEIHRLRPGMSIERYERLLDEGKLCFGVKEGDRLVANMWCDLDEINSILYSRPLSDQEGYLFDAFSDPEYRGENLAPFLRLRCYEALQALGRPEIYSVTEYFNTPARRFKAKLAARDEALIIYVNLFDRFSRSWIVRRY